MIFLVTVVVESFEGARNNRGNAESSNDGIEELLEEDAGPESCGYSCGAVALTRLCCTRLKASKAVSIKVGITCASNVFWLNPDMSHRLNPDGIKNDGEGMNPFQSDSMSLGEVLRVRTISLPVNNADTEETAADTP